MSRVRRHSLSVRSAGDHLRGPIRKLVPAEMAIVSAVFVAAPSCSPSAADDIVRALRPVADDVDTLRSSRWAPPRAAPVVVAPAGDEISAQAGRLATPLENVPPDSRQEVVNVACEVTDAVEAASGNVDDISTYFATRFNNAYSYRLQVEELAANLYEAGNASDQAVIFGRAAVCVWGSSG